MAVRYSPKGCMAGCIMRAHPVRRLLPSFKWASGSCFRAGELAQPWRITRPPAQCAEAGSRFSVLQLS